eukprot:CAMPEP_0172466212 /NCGR_PEP_ID=MMETSP1065-20121228/55514_1 /TAXON_ID=265537 /ORGANISM="Amphiprora paludosa, Strain CCMP125" /LENGTH=620 /DNA_ID=CAMNT_0013222953 /DNA_START=55 /DNA_END=1917 /DNA_ORIENTATION=+
MGSLVLFLLSIPAVFLLLVTAVAATVEFIALRKRYVRQIREETEIWNYISQALQRDYVTVISKSDLITVEEDEEEAPDCAAARLNVSNDGAVDPEQQQPQEDLEDMTHEESRSSPLPEHMTTIVSTTTKRSKPSLLDDMKKKAIKQSPARYFCKVIKPSEERIRDIETGNMATEEEEDCDISACSLARDDAEEDDDEDNKYLILRAGEDEKHDESSPSELIRNKHKTARRLKRASHQDHNTLLTSPATTIVDSSSEIVIGGGVDLEAGGAPHDQQGTIPQLTSPGTRNSSASGAAAAVLQRQEHQDEEDALPPQQEEGDEQQSPQEPVLVAGTCAICLCPYRVGEQVSYPPLSCAAAAAEDSSREDETPPTANVLCHRHAFHTLCITEYAQRTWQEQVALRRWQQERQPWLQYEEDFDQMAAAAAVLDFEQASAGIFSEYSIDEDTEIMIDFSSSSSAFDSSSISSSSSLADAGAEPEDLHSVGAVEEDALAIATEEPRNRTIASDNDNNMGRPQTSATQRNLRANQTETDLRAVAATLFQRGDDAAPPTRPAVAPAPNTNLPMTGTAAPTSSSSPTKYGTIPCPLCRKPFVQWTKKRTTPTAVNDQAASSSNSPEVHQV